MRKVLVFLQISTENVWVPYPYPIALYPSPSGLSFTEKAQESVAMASTLPT